MDTPKTNEPISPTTSATMIYEPGTGSLLNVGSGQSGGGTADALPAASVQADEPRSLVHEEAPELAAAAMAANQQPAPTDPIEQIVSQLHTRVSALEDMAAQPSTAAEIASLRSVVDSVINWMETQAPLMDKVWHLFNVHWAGKMPEAPQHAMTDTNKGV